MATIVDSANTTNNIVNAKDEVTTPPSSSVTTTNNKTNATSNDNKTNSTANDNTTANNKLAKNHKKTPLDHVYRRKFSDESNINRRDLILLLKSHGCKSNFYDKNGVWVGKSNGDLNK